MNTTEKIRSILRSSIDIKRAMLADKKSIERIERVVDIIVEAFQQGGRLYLCGNGGSAADAQHLAAELTGKLCIDREPLPAEALHVNTSFITAVANDYGYEEVYRRAVRAHGRRGDVLIGISTSGNSKNVLLAQDEAKKRGMTIVSFSGKTGGKMKATADYLFTIPSTNTQRIQEAYMLIGHTICELVEAKMFAHGKKP